MLGPRRAYTIGAGSVLLSRATSALAGVISLWFLSRILNTDDFANYVVTMSIVMLGGYLAGLGLERSMLLRIAELQTRPGLLLGRGLMLKIAAAVLILSIFAATGLFLFFTEQVASEGLDKWVKWMTPIVPATALSLVLIAWFRANHMVATSELMQGLIDGTRCLLMIGILLFGMGPHWVATAAVVAAIVPLAVLTICASGNSTNAPDDFRLRDVSYGLQFLLIRVSQMGLNQFGIIAVGLWAASIEAAQFAVVTRLVALAAVGQMAFSSTYSVRLRTNLAKKDHAAIAREFSTSRSIAYLITLAAAVLFHVFGVAALRTFGNFTNGYTALLILMAGQLAFVSFGLNIQHLSMTSNLKVAVYIRISSTALFVALLFILVPAFSDIGAALSFLIANLCLSVARALALHRCGGPVTFPIPYVASIFGSIIGPNRTISDRTEQGALITQRDVCVHEKALHDVVYDKTCRTD